METLTVRTSSRQLAGLLVFALVLAVVAVLATRSHLAGGDPRGRILAYGIAAEILLLIAAWCAVRYAGAFTECTQAGIRSRGLGPEWRCGWAEVSQIAIRPGRRGPTRTVTLITADGRRLALGAPVAGGVMPNAQFDSSVRQILEYWHRATGAGVQPGPGALPVLDTGDRAGRSRPPAGVIIRAVVLLVLLVAAAAIPVTLAESGAALAARLGGGEQGSFTGYGFTCAPACYWVGEFTPRGGSHPRHGMAIAAGPGLVAPGDQIPAVYLGSGAMVYRPGGGTSWIPFTILLAIVTGCLSVEVLAAVWRLSRRWPHPGDGREPGPRQPGRPRVSGRARTRVLVTGATVVLIAGTSGAAIALHPPPPFAPSPAALACADYGEWLMAQAGSGGIGQVDLGALARAQREGARGRLSQDLTALFYDEKAAIAAKGIVAAQPVLTDAHSEMNTLTADCA